MTHTKLRASTLQAVALGPVTFNSAQRCAWCIVMIALLLIAAAL